jgi:hypothetical protein
MAELNSDDLYQLRKLQMEIGKRELEHKHNLMGSEQAIDPMSGTISGSPGRNGKGHTEELLATGKGETAS